MPGLHQTVLRNAPEDRRRQILKSLTKFIQNELTDVQRDTFVRYHLKGQSVTQIAEARGVNKSAVSRNLKRAEQKVAKIANYLI